MREYTTGEVIWLAALGVVMLLFLTWLLQVFLWGVFGISAPYWPLFAGVFILNWLVTALRRPRV